MGVASLIQAILLAFSIWFASSSINETASTLSFNLSNANKKTYRDFIQDLRNELTKLGKNRSSYGIPLLPQREDVRDAVRFVYVDLTDYPNNNIRVAIDVVNAYVVSYAANGTAYFLRENAPENPPPINYTTLFQDAATRIELNFYGSYDGLGRAAGRLLDEIPLGLTQLDEAIRQLYYATSQQMQSVGLFVIIQMFSEAARFRVIEKLVSTRMEIPYSPLMRVLAIESLETQWSALSQQMQWAALRNEMVFTRTIELVVSGNTRHRINNVTECKRVSNIAMLLYHRNPPAPAHVPPRHVEL